MGLQGKSRRGFRNLRVDAFTSAGIEGDYRVLRRTHEQILMDCLEAHDYKEGSIIEISAKRLRHSMQTAVRLYAGPADRSRAEGSPRGVGVPNRQGQGSWRLGVGKNVRHGMTENHDLLRHVLMEE
jgi:hypothetical protein